MKQKFKLTASEGSPKKLPELAVFLRTKGKDDDGSLHVTLVVGDKEVFHLYEDGEYVLEASALHDLGFERFIG